MLRSSGRVPTQGSCSGRAGAEPVTPPVLWGACAGAHGGEGVWGVLQGVWGVAGCRGCCRVWGLPRSSQSRSQKPPSLTSVAAMSPSWLMPSACFWSTQTRTMRRRSTRWATVMASSLCSHFCPAPADLVPSTRALASCCPPLLPSTAAAGACPFPNASEYSLAFRASTGEGIAGPLRHQLGWLPLGLAKPLCKPYPRRFLRLLSVFAPNVE